MRYIFAAEFKTLSLNDIGIDLKVFLLFRGDLFFHTPLNKQSFCLIYALVMDLNLGQDLGWGGGG